jgi:hypothetical protein
MYMIPFQINPQEYSVFVVLEEENLERMKAYDPAEFNLWKLGDSWLTLRLRDVIIGYATGPDSARVMELCRAGKPNSALRHLSRGFRYRPDQGDSNLPYEGEPK